MAVIAVWGVWCYQCGDFVYMDDDHVEAVGRALVHEQYRHRVTVHDGNGLMIYQTPS